MSVLKGDYIGFSYNGVHSSDLGIVRTSDGSRFNENLLPTMQDKTVQVPGGDGTYYFGSYFTQRQFSVSFAYDSLTEEQVARLKAHFGDKKIHSLVFDERPYKVYQAKVTGTATLRYIPFDEGSTHRIYKGEGTIQFTCYQPHAICSKKWLDEYDNTNKEEWALASGLKDIQANYDLKVFGTNTINLWNPGDIGSHFQLQVNFVDNKIPANKIFISGDPACQLEWSGFTSKNGDAYVKINSKLNLIEGYTAAGVKSGNIYNQHIKAGAFFKIPLGESTFGFDEGLYSHLNTAPIEYFYYYF